MGADLIPGVTGFEIDPFNFSLDDEQSKGEIEEGCVTEGLHRVLRFEMRIHNYGDEDLIIGNPEEDHKEWFEYSAVHDHYHFKQFNEFELYDKKGMLAVPGKKQGFCLADVRLNDGSDPPPAEDRQFNPETCDWQGISAGWMDVYKKTVACQFLVIDGLADGDYTLVVRTNAGKIVPEDNYDNNSICVGLRFSGDTVTELSQPSVYVEKVTNVVNFTDVPEGETSLRPVVFDVWSCGPVDFEFVGTPNVLTGPPETEFGTPLDPPIPLDVAGTLTVRKAYAWVSYKGTNDGEMATGDVTIRSPLTDEQWTVPITANTIARPTAAVMLVLDQSWSMTYDSGIPDKSREHVLKFALLTLIKVIDKDNGVGIVTFDDNAHKVSDVLEVGPLLGGMGRGEISFEIVNYEPVTSTATTGNTSIGDGVIEGQDVLKDASGYDFKAMIVLTDGHENRAAWIRDSSVQTAIDSLDSRIYAIGLGTPQQLRPAALDELAKATGGRLDMTGKLNVDQEFRLVKFYQQILAKITNKEVVLDPEGYVAPGQEHSHNFDLNETDITVDIILVSSAPSGVFDYHLLTPDGEVIDPTVAFGNPAISFVPSDSVTYYRIALPVPIGAGPARDGTWKAVLRINEPYYKRYLGSLDNEPDTLNGVMAHGVRYSLNIYAYSNLRMPVTLAQSSYEPGATLTLRAAMTEYGLPVDQRGTVEAELVRPDSTTSQFSLPEIEPGIFETTLTASQAGVYTFQVRGAGKTLRGLDFTREDLVTGSVWQGGDEPPPTSDDPGQRHRRLCHQLTCILKVFGKHLAEKGIDVNALDRCLKEFCDDPEEPTESEVIRLRQEFAEALSEPRVLRALSDFLKEVEPLQ